MARWNAPKSAVSDVAADAKSVTGFEVKNQVHIAPTRLVVTGMPCFGRIRRDALGDRLVASMIAV